MSYSEEGVLSALGSAQDQTALCPWPRCVPVLLLASGTSGWMWPACLAAAGQSAGRAPNPQASPQDLAPAGMGWRLQQAPCPPGATTVTAAEKKRAGFHDFFFFSFPPLPPTPTCCVH